MFYRGLALLDQLKACASASPDIWAVPELEKPILKKLNAAVMNVFLEDLACAKNPFLGGTNHSPLNNPAITLFENYIAEQCEQLSEDILFDIRPFEKVRLYVNVISAYLSTR